MLVTYLDEKVDDSHSIAVVKEQHTIIDRVMTHYSAMSGAWTVCYFRGYAAVNCQRGRYSIKSKQKEFDQT